MKIHHPHVHFHLPNGAVWSLLMATFIAMLAVTSIKLIAYIPTLLISLHETATVPDTDLGWWAGASAAAFLAVFWRERQLGIT